MGIQQRDILNHWNYLSSLEQDVIKISRFIDLSHKNNSTFSIELLRLLFSASSEVDVVAKFLCRSMNKISVLIMMRKFLCGVFLFSLVATTLADEEVKSIKTPLLGITAVSDEESEFIEPEGGAMEMSRYFATHLQSELIFCGNTVSAIFDVWLASNQIIPTERTITPDSVFIRVWDKAQEGVFEARYLASNQPAYVRVSLDYYAISGQQLPIESTQAIINTYALSSLWESLAEAIECDS